MGAERSPDGARPADEVCFLDEACSRAEVQSPGGACFGHGADSPCEVRFPVETRPEGGALRNGLPELRLAALLGEVCCSQADCSQAGGPGCRLAAEQSRVGREACKAHLRDWLSQRRSR